MGLYRTIDGVTYVLKMNPWVTMAAPGIRVHKNEIWAKVPSWFRNKAARPAGVKAINDIFTYVRSKVKGYRVQDAVRVMGEVMSHIKTITTKSALDAQITTAIRLIAPQPARVTMERRAELRAAARARVPAYEALARELGIPA